MNKHYRLLSKITLPYHDDDEHMTTITVYDIDDSKYDELCEIEYEHGTVEHAVLDDLGLRDDYCVAPGALYHMYDAMMLRRCVIVADTVAYNV